MYPSSELQLIIRYMPDSEIFNSPQECYSHVGDLPSMEVTVPYRETRGYHVGISDGFDLDSRTKPEVEQIQVEHETACASIDKKKIN